MKKWALLIISFSLLASMLHAKEINKGKVSYQTHIDDSGDYTIKVIVLDMPEVYGFEFEAEYDPDILKLRTLNPKKALSKSSFLDHQSVSEVFNNDNKGIVKYAISRLRPAPQVSGDGCLIELPFEVLTYLTENALQIKKIKFGDMEGNVILPEFSQPILEVGISQNLIVKENTTKAESGNKSSYKMVISCLVTAIIVAVISLIIQRRRLSI